MNMGVKKMTDVSKTFPFYVFRESIAVCVCNMHFDICAFNLLKSQTGRHAHLTFPVKMLFCAEQFVPFH